jgi:YD repeat-containing protein
MLFMKHILQIKKSGIVTKGNLLCIKLKIRCLRNICWIILLNSIGNTSLSLAQGSAPDNVPKVVPPTPTAAALERYGQIPVSPYTGVPNISIPLYEIKVRDLTVPISLSYHAAGFRVNEEASWVGLGWSLQAGGVLTHTTRNLDDLLYFIPQNGHAPYGMPDCTPKNGGEVFQGDPYSGATTIMAGASNAFQGPDIATVVGGVSLPYARDGVYENQQIDWEPDDYRFTMGGYSGSFAFDQQGKIHLLEQQKITISYSYTGAAKGVVWLIRTPDGFQYEFGAAEFSSTPTPDVLRKTTTSAWYLTRIVSPLGEEATFTYDTGIGIFNQLGYTQTEVKQWTRSPTATPPTNTLYAVGGASPQYLRRIDFKTGYVLFERDAVRRKDLRGGERFKRMAIYNKSDQLLKSYDIQASYFETPSNLTNGYLTADGGASAAVDSARAYEGKRLRLDAVIERDQHGLAKPPTSFTYNSTPLPVKSSYSVDYWGYYNGRSNRSLIPTYAGTDLFGAYVIYYGADRSPAAAPMQAAILQSITYPTGGKNVFSFEPHEYGNLTEEDDQLVEGGITLRLQADNVNPNYSYSTNTTIRVKAPTPVTLDYTLGVETGGDLEQKKARTTLQLIDSTTNRPFTSGSPGFNNYVQAQWGFSSSTSKPSNPYNIPNWVQVTGHAVVLLPAGSYTLTAYTPICTSSNTGACHASVAVQGSYPVIQRLANSTIRKLLAGGLRIKRIETINNLNPALNQVQVFSYDTPITTTGGQSAMTGNGVLLNRPRFSKILAYYYGNDPYYQLQLSSYSHIALSAGAKGSAVGYSRVSVLEGSLGEGGKTVYSYYCEPDRAARYIDNQPNVPTRANELNGSLLEQAAYRKINNDFQLLTKVTNTYESVLDPQYHHDVPAVLKGEHFTNSDGTGTTRQRLYFYPIPVNWVRLVSTTKSQYDPHDLAKTLTVSTRYTYDTLKAGHMQISQTRTRRSDGSTILALTTYPADYTSVTSGSLALMRSPEIFQHAAVVESTTQVYGPNQTATDAKTVTGTYTTYTRPSTTSRFLPAVISQLKLAQPQLGLRPAAPTIPPLDRYFKQQSLYYEVATANLQQVRRIHGLPSIYLWGYANTLLVAKVENATFTQVQAALGVDLNTLKTEQQLRDAFTRLRQQLPQARVTSFTHQPLVGMASQTNPDGRTFFYEYDGLQRLVRTRDEQGRILSQQQYHYAQP